MNRYELSDAERFGMVEHIRSTWWPDELRDTARGFANWYKLQTAELQSLAVYRLAAESPHDATAWNSLDSVFVDSIKDRRTLPDALRRWYVDKREGRITRPQKSMGDHAVRDLLIVSAVAELLEATKQTHADTRKGVLFRTAHHRNPRKSTVYKIVGDAFYLSYEAVDKVWTNHNGIILARQSPPVA